MTWPVVKLEVFEGPFDLLLELAARQKVDLAEVSLAALTEDFLRHIEEYDVPMASQGEWLVVAAQLLLVKARLARRGEASEDEEDEGQLRARVRLYQLYRNKAEWLRRTWGERILSGRGEKLQGALLPVVVSQEQLRVAFGRILRRLPKPIRARAHLVKYGRTLDECLTTMRAILQKKPMFVFQQELEQSDRNEVAVSFLALLELQRSHQAELEQGGNFEQLIVRRV